MAIPSIISADRSIINWIKWCKIGSLLCPTIAGGGGVSTLQDAHHLRTREQLPRGAWSMEIPAGPLVVSGTCDRALPAPEMSKQEAAGPKLHIPVFSNSKLGHQVQEQQPSRPTAAYPARPPKDKDKKAQPLKDGLKDILKEKTIHAWFGNKQR